MLIPAVHKSSLTLRFLGPFEAAEAGKPLVRPRARAGQWLLAALALSSPRPQSRDALASALWPESDTAQALYNLRRNLTDLRRILGPHAHRIQSPNPRTIAFDLDGVQCDIITFDAAIRAGRWEEAVSVYRGPLLEGDDPPAAFTAERAGREESFLAALENVAQEQAARGAWAAARAQLQRLLERAPLRESAVRALLRACVSDGDTLGAIQAFRRFRLRLHEQCLGEPDAETVALFRSLSLSRNSGSQNSGSQNSGRPAAADAAAVTVPVPLTRLIARDRELSGIAHLLGADDNAIHEARGARLVTITGSGGVGKTRLALAAAQTIAARSSGRIGGVFFIDLASVTDGALVVQTVLQALGVLRGASGADALSRLRAFCADRSLLVVMDNCEQVVSACARLARALLETCPGVRLLATSRQSLGVAGERRFALLPLSAQAGRELLLERVDAVRGDAKSGRTAGDAAAVARIVELLDGLPLALEMAAAWASALTLPEIAARLERGHLPLRSSDDVASRQQTLRATFDWSFSLLSEDERTLLLRLSAFSGGANLDAVEAVTRADLGSLRGLVEKSLVVVDSGRYRMLETVRGYASDGLNRDIDEEAATFARHADYFCAFAEEADSRITGPEQTLYLNRLEAEHANFRSVLSRFVGDEHRGLWLAGALSMFWKMRGYLHEGEQWLKRTIAASNTGEQSALRAKALTGAGILCYDRGDFVAADTYFGDAMRIARARGDRAGQATLHVNLGNIGYRQGRFSAARGEYEQGLALHRAAENPRGIASALGSLGNVADAEGDYESARRLQEESLAISRALGDLRGIAYTLHNLGNLAVRDGRNAAALPLYEESLAMKRELGDRRAVAALLVSLGLFMGEAQQLDRMHAYLTEALTLAQAIDDRFQTISALEGLVWYHAARNPLHCALLWGAAEAGRLATNTPLAADEQAHFPPIVEAARQTASSVEFDAALARGRTLTLEQAARLALDSTGTAR